MRLRRGFTLIELLVVVAIIAILAAILFPVMSAARERAHTIRCVANLKQLASAVIMYASDNDGRVCNPRIKYLSPDWAGCQGVGLPCYPERGQIWRYTRTRDLYLCPVDRNAPAASIQGDPDARKGYPLSYSMNLEFLDRRGPQQTLIKLDTVPRPKYTMMLVHEKRSTINDGNCNWYNLMSGNQDDVPSDIHYSGTCLVYCDGHAVWRSQKDLVKELTSGQWTCYY